MQRKKTQICQIFQIKFSFPKLADFQEKFQQIAKNIEGFQFHFIFLRSYLVCSQIWLYIWLNYFLDNHHHFGCYIKKNPLKKQTLVSSSADQGLFSPTRKKETTMISKVCVKEQSSRVLLQPRAAAAAVLHVKLCTQSISSCAQYATPQNYFSHPSLVIYFFLQPHP